LQYFLQIGVVVFVLLIIFSLLTYVIKTFNYYMFLHLSIT